MARGSLLMAGALALMAAGGAAGCGTAQTAAGAPPWVYVAGTAGELRTLNVATLEVAGTMQLPGAAAAAAWDGRRGQLWVATAASGGGALLAVGGGGQRRQRVRRLDFAPRTLLVGGGGRVIYVAGRGAQGGVLARLVPATGVWRQVPLGADLVALATAPGGELLAADGAGQALYILAAATLAVHARVALAAPDVAVVALPYGHKAFALCPAIAQVVSVDLERGGVLAYLQVGADPQRMALKPDSGELYVSSYGAGTVSAIDTSANQVTDSMLAGRQPIGLAVSPDGQWLYVADAGSNAVDAIRLDDRKLIATIPVGLEPTDLSLDATGNLLFAEDRGSSDIAVIRTGPRNLMGLLPAAPNPVLLSVAGTP